MNIQKTVRIDTETYFSNIHDNFITILSEKINDTSNAGTTEEKSVNFVCVTTVKIVPNKKFKTMLDIIKDYAKNEPNSKYNRTHFRALYIRHTQPRCTLLVFLNGVIIVIGGRNLDISLFYIHHFIYKIGVSVKIVKITPANKIYSGRFNSELDFNLLKSNVMKSIDQHGQIEEKVFSGLIVNLKVKSKNNNKIKVKIIIFRTGNFNLLSPDKELKNILSAVNEYVHPFMKKKRNDRLYVDNINLRSIHKAQFEGKDKHLLSLIFKDQESI